MKNRLQKLTLAGVAALGLSMLASTAFTAPGMGWDDCPGYGGPRGSDGPKQRGDKQARWEEQMEALHTKLKLNPDQEERWKAFTAAHSAQRQAMAQNWQRMRQSQTTTTEHFNTQIQFMEQRLAGMRSVAKAAEDLYKDLTPEQKTLMDDFFASRPRRGPGPKPN